MSLDELNYKIKQFIDVLFDELIHNDNKSIKKDLKNSIKSLNNLSTEINEQLLQKR